jgi:hypothetical protein
LENVCQFSPDRVHRYRLIHRINPLFGQRLIMGIGLNPSTADENKLDPTLTRIARFSEREDIDGFWMSNLFGLRTPYPKEMMAAPDPNVPATTPRSSKAPPAAISSSPLGESAASTKTAPMPW